jgi:signal peptidase I
MHYDVPMAGKVSESQTVHHSDHDGSIVETIQSLVIAFVLAMTFRGFVTEGFVIPTGSMAPTLLGQHMLVQSGQTGVTFPVGVDPGIPLDNPVARLVDPMLGPRFWSMPNRQSELRKRMGDRILVLKCLYPFSAPHRFDVVVFKNPTDPLGDAANYIKRLVGLPNEQVWLADGDVFARPLSGDRFVIQRKPEHVQRAVWQRVHQSDYIPMSPNKLSDLGQHYPGPPWISDSRAWNLSGRSYTCDTASATELRWDNTRRLPNDWTPYNMLALPPPETLLVSDLRVQAGIVAQQPGLKTTFELRTRSHIFQFVLGDGKAIMRMAAASDDGPQNLLERVAPVSLPTSGKVINVEFWHVDQAMHMFIDGHEVMEPLLYDWTASERLAYGAGANPAEHNDMDELIATPASPPHLRWRFEGSPLTLHRVRVDRDLYYRPGVLDPYRQQRNKPLVTGHAFGTHPLDNAAILGPDQFMMCGDNNQMSLDSRLWGSPHPLVASQIDPAPFVVNRKLLLGKAWVVYFPAPFAATEGGTAFIPDFGRLRFIR